MNSVKTPTTTSQKIKDALNRGYKKKVLIAASGLSHPTFEKRLKDNSWEASAILGLKSKNLI